MMGDDNQRTLEMQLEVDQRWSVVSIARHLCININITPIDENAFD